MPQSENEEVYIPYISDEYPSSFPPGDNDEGQAWLQWQLTLNPDQKATYNRHLDEAIKLYTSSAASERQRRLQFPKEFSTERISKEFNFSWGSKTESERVASHGEVYKLTAEQMSRFKIDKEKSVAEWELAQSITLQGGSEAEKRDDCTGKQDTGDDEDDDEIYSDSDSDSDSGDSQKTIRGL